MSKIWTTVKDDEVTRCMLCSMPKSEEVWYIWAIRFVLGSGERCEAGMTGWSLSTSQYKVGELIEFGARCLHSNSIYAIYYFLISGKFLNLNFLISKKGMIVLIQQYCSG